MTGEPVFTSVESAAGPCCARETASLLTSLSTDAPSCCSEAKGSCCPKADADAMLTSTGGAECEASCEKGCCKDKETAVNLTENQEQSAPVVEEAVVEEATTEEAVAELTEAQ
jgi:hypothetical protein